jgi:hypothetical protein
MVAGALACLAITILLAAWGVFGKSAGDNATSAKSRRQSPATNRPATPRAGATPTDAPFTLVDDDGQSLWMSPTEGRPLNLAYLPPGVQIIVVLRPDALAGHTEGKKVLEALGPIGQLGLAQLDEMLLDPHGVSQLAVGLSATSDGRWQTALVARLSSGPTAAQHLATKLPNAVENTHNGIKHLVADGTAYYAPASDQQLLVIAPSEAIAEIIDLQGDPPPLRREFERLLSHTDADRHFTLIAAPNFLFSEGRGVFNGQIAPLREPLFWFLGDEFAAAALSMHWDNDFFVELLAAPTLDTSTQRAASMLSERVGQIPDRLEEHVVGLQAQPYGRRILARFPAMVRKLAAYTRSGFESDHAVLRCYLPAIAGHNLLMGAELTLAESIGAMRSPHAVAVATESSKSVTSDSVNERLKRNTTLSFPRDTLEAALEQLSRDVGVDIVIAGTDLQAEGITKNQSFGIDLSDRPAEEILVAILQLANPDKAATGPQDPRQKLVYVISQGSGKDEQIVITTRTGAAARGDELPAVFRAK